MLSLSITKQKSFNHSIVSVTQIPCYILVNSNICCQTSLMVWTKYQEINTSIRQKQLTLKMMKFVILRAMIKGCLNLLRYGYWTFGLCWRDLLHRIQKWSNYLSMRPCKVVIQQQNTELVARCSTDVFLSHRLHWRPPQACIFCHRG